MQERTTFLYPTTRCVVFSFLSFQFLKLHPQLTIMHASCQEKYKHSIPPQNTLDLYHPAFPPPDCLPDATQVPSNARINITFRFYRPDFHPSTIPRCKCNVPTILRHDMKERGGRSDRYWWCCYAGAQNDGKGCDFWKEMDMAAEGRRQQGQSMRQEAAVTPLEELR